MIYILCTLFIHNILHARKFHEYHEVAVKKTFESLLESKVIYHTADCLCFQHKLRMRFNPDVECLSKMALKTNAFLKRMKNILKGLLCQRLETKKSNKGIFLIINAVTIPIIIFTSIVLVALRNRSK